jgi:prepilin signal peptidase PulO-like enzyme (type II secretory pathway)
MSVWLAAALAHAVLQPAWPSMIVVTLIGIVIGRLLTAAVALLVEPDPRRDQLLHRVVQTLAVAVALGLWWWEVPARGQLPDVTLDPDPGEVFPLLVRYAAHLGLFALLSAASWVDLRHRVIPDAITVPGVLLGLAWTAAFPDALLPIAREIPRSFAPPLREADVLGMLGGLRAGWPAWLEGCPEPRGLLGAAAIFAVWWLAGTEPTAVWIGSRAAWWRRLTTPRCLVAALGGAVIAAAWLSAGSHWRAIVSSLVGMAVAAGMIWLTRAGASRALGREAMGFGDVTLMAMIGVWLGWQPCVLACFLAVFIGLAHGIAQIVTRSETELPFGPSLCLASASVVVWWRPLWERTAVFFERPQEMAAVVALVIGLTAVTLWIWNRIRPFPAGES